MMVLASDLGEILSDISLTSLTGILTVFVLLLLLVVVFWGFGKVMAALENKNDTAQPVASAPAAAPAVPAAAPAAIVGNTQPVTTTPTVQNGIPAETVAVISAAVAAVAPAGTQYAVKSITKK